MQLLHTAVCIGARSDCFTEMDYLKGTIILSIENRNIRKYRYIWGFE